MCRVAFLMPILLVCAGVYGGGANAPFGVAMSKNRTNEVNSHGGNLMVKVGSASDCVHNYDLPKKGFVVIGAHDSLATVAKNSSVVELNMAAMFELEETSYLSIGENIEVIINTDLGKLILPETLLIEFSLTDKRFTEEGRDRLLTERYVNGVTARVLPLYYALDCLNGDIDKLEQQVIGLGFKPVTLDVQKKLSEVKKLFELNDAKGRLLSHTIAAWRKGDLGIYLSVVQAKINGDLSNAKGNKYLYNLNFDTVYIPDSWYWTEI